MLENWRLKRVLRMIIKRKIKLERHLSLFVCQKCNQVFSKDHESQKYCAPCKKEKDGHWYEIKKYMSKLREEVYLAYGKKCALCGEEDEIVLTIDHVNNNGKEEREIFKSTQQILLKIKRENYPSDYQLLCRNCNWRKHIFYRQLKTRKSPELERENNY